MSPRLIGDAAAIGGLIKAAHRTHVYDIQAQYCAIVVVTRYNGSMNIISDVPVS